MAWWDVITDVWNKTGNALNSINPIKGLDLNVTHGSAFTGAGTPWGEGPQDPYQPQYRSFDPSNYKGMDTSALGAALRQQIGQGAARSRERLRGSFAGPGGGGADLNSALANLEGQQGQAENELSANLAQQDWANRWNQYLAEQQQEENKANRDLMRYQQQVGERAAPWNFLGNLVGTGTGAALGGLGGALGANLLSKKK